MFGMTYSDKFSVVVLYSGLTVFVSKIKLVVETRQKVVRQRLILELKSDRDAIT
jgi:hypothetical protein